MLKKLYLSLVFLLFAVSLFLGIDRLCHRSSTQFSPHKIRTSNLFMPQKTPMLSMHKREELNKILNQKLSFYHKGKHAYSFISEDGNYIVKFMRQQRIKPKSWLAYLPFSFNPYYQEFASTKQEARQRVRSWQMAQEHLWSETGVVYVHSSRKEKLRKKVIVLDKDLEPHTIDLDKTIFCIQRHADLFYVDLFQKLREHDLSLIQQRITDLFFLIAMLREKGALSAETIRSFDVGIAADRIIQINIDYLCTNPAMCIRKPYSKETLLSMTHNFKTWIDKHCPELSPYFIECLDHELKDIK